MVSMAETNPNRINRLKASLIFLVGCALWLALVGVVLRKITLRLDPNVPKIQAMMALQKNDHDVLYLGDSTTLEGVNPEVVDRAIGTSSYNLASGGQQILASEMVLRHYLDHNPKPDLVTLGLFVGPENFSDINSNVYLALKPEHRKGYERKRNDFYGRRFERSYKFFNLVPAFRYRGGVEWLIRYLVKGSKRSPTFIKGHLALSGHEKLSQKLDAKTLVLDEKALISFADFCQQEKLNCLVFEMPTHQSYKAARSGRKAVLSAIDEIVKNRSNVDFVSFNDSSGPLFEETLWLNLNHFNGDGAKAFTKNHLVKTIKSHLSSLKQQPAP